MIYSYLVTIAHLLTQIYKKVHVLYYLPRYTTLAIAHANSMQVPPDVAHMLTKAIKQQDS